MQSLKSSNRQVGGDGKLLATYSAAVGIKCSWPFSSSFVDLSILERFSVGRSVYLHKMSLKSMGRW